MIRFVQTVAAAVLLIGSTVEVRSDAKMTLDGVQRLQEIWMVTYVNDAGVEVVAQAKITTGEYAPMIAADVHRLESMIPAARELAKASSIEMRLIKFSNRTDVEQFRP